MSVNVAGGGRAERVSAADLVYAGLLKGIESGRLASGRRLSERSLCEEFDVSRGSVREALSRLRGEGWISQTAEHGAAVRRLSEEDILERLPIITNLFSLAARLAASHLAPREARQKVIDAQAGFTGYEAAADPERRLAIKRFYDAILERAENSALTQLMRTLRAYDILVAKIISRGESPLGPARRTVQAILTKEPQDAERAARDLIERSGC